MKLLTKKEKKFVFIYLPLIVLGIALSFYPIKDWMPFATFFPLWLQDFSMYQLFNLAIPYLIPTLIIGLVLVMLWRFVK
ncbi:MAG: hypothetical protein ACTSR2_03030 [Candidatus Hodarchaeales archaeon]